MFFFHDLLSFKTFELNFFSYYCSKIYHRNGITPNVRLFDMMAVLVITPNQGEAMELKLQVQQSQGQGIMNMMKQMVLQKMPSFIFLTYSREMVRIILFKSIALYENKNN